MARARIYPNDVAVPNSVGVKTTGRVAPMKKVANKGSIEKQAVAIIDDVSDVEKTAAAPIIINQAAMPLSTAIRQTALTAMAGTAILGGANYLLNKLDSIHTGFQGRKALEEAKRINPKLQSIPPQVLQQYYEVVSSSAPSIATKPLLLANYLDYMISHEGSLNFAAYKQLAELEGTMANTAKANRPLGDLAAKAIIDSAVKVNFR